MVSKATWMVRAETGGILFDVFKDESLVAIGWSEVGDLSSQPTRQDIHDKVSKIWPDWPKGRVSSAAGQLFRFCHEICLDDRIVTYDPSRRMYLVGTVTSDYQFKPNRVALDGSEEEWPNVRSVQWDGEISRDALTLATKNSLGSISTLFRLSDNAATDVERALAGVPLETGSQEEEETEDALREDIEAKAFEFIKDRITRLDWDDMQELIAGLLRSMGYKTRVSPSGPDRGKDIVASPDGFGFENPRIVVEVKHRPNSAMGSTEIRSFLGGRHQNDKGLYVSTGGFTKDAYYEAERANIPLTLMELDNLVQAIIEHYEKMDIETQRLIPLKKIYWPA